MRKQVEIGYINTNYYGKKFQEGQMVYCFFQDYDTFYKVESLDYWETDYLTPDEITLERELFAFRPVGKVFVDFDGKEYEVMEDNGLSVWCDDVEEKKIMLFSKLEVMFWKEEKKKKR